MTMSKRFSLTLPMKIYHDIDSFSREKHLTKSQLLQMTFQNYMKSKPATLTHSECQSLISNLNGCQNQISRIGNNINQFQYAINVQLRQGRFDRATVQKYIQLIEHSAKLLTQINNQVADLRKEVGKRCR